ncbi:MAG: 4-aminobutyrate--2-oxoglutarate transaminase [Burkholderia sp.]|jgi:4-aminobutyrate aminotransferase/(S)-3-amino-2-methylpropionate transaminase|uniref:4-aminobutyrate--2-oxoglutarate transaminase n=1 Tax=Burkholderia sp. TaxID=36773 RepID=UPI00282EF293|nr:4-aminobutyrate--2-oxoglutarate transaminase [Burkholderia sp.]MDR0242928.1 4-aminobutyrate--2-oxoglutarate transaminase [Burkholderia sp.]
MQSTTHSLQQRREASIPRGAATAHPIFVDRAIGSEIWDVEGKHYIDFASGIAVNGTGHLHPKVVAAMRDQLDRYAHVAFPVSAYEPYIAVCEKLNAIAPIQDARSVLFTTGAEATENAVKVARIHTGRLGVITFTGSFHGRTSLAMAMTGKVAPLRSDVPPTHAGVYHIPFPIPHHGIWEDDSLKALYQLFRSTISPDQVAAIVIEPVQGEGGFYQAPRTFIETLRMICDTHGICLVADEVQSGFGRTGKYFAIEHYGVEPDLIPVAKAVGGGLPLAGLIGRASVMNSAVPGALGGTFAGNPVACAAALAVFDVIEEEKLLQRASAIGARLVSRLRDIKERSYAMPIGDIRNLGAMVAFELVTERGGNGPNATATKMLADRAREHGVLLLPCGVFGNTIRISTPLNITDELLDEGLDRLTKALLQDAK